MRVRKRTCALHSCSENNRGSIFVPCALYVFFFLYWRWYGRSSAISLSWKRYIYKLLRLAVTKLANWPMSSLRSCGVGLCPIVCYSCRLF